MIVALRLVALLGTVAHGVSWLVARLVPVLPRRVPGALLVACLLLGWAWLTFNATRAEIAARPEPRGFALVLSLLPQLGNEQPTWQDGRQVLSSSTR